MIELNESSKKALTVIVVLLLSSTILNVVFVGNARAFDSLFPMEPSETNFDGWEKAPSEDEKIKDSQYKFVALFEHASYVRFSFDGETSTPDGTDYIDDDNDNTTEKIVWKTYSFGYGSHKIKVTGSNSESSASDSISFERVDDDGLSYSEELETTRTFDYQKTSLGIQNPDQPNVPQNLHKAHSGTDYIKLGWDAVNKAVNYTVFRDGDKIKEGITDNSYRDGGLQPGTGYDYQVKAVNYEGESDRCDKVTLTTASEDDGGGGGGDSDGTSFGLEVMSVDQSHVKLTWNQFNTIGSISIYRKSESQSSFNKIDEVDYDNTIYSDYSVKQDTWYEYKIKKDGQYSDVVTAYTDSSDIDPMMFQTTEIGPASKVKYSFDNLDYEGYVKYGIVRGIEIRCEDEVDSLDIYATLKGKGSTEYNSKYISADNDYQGVSIPMNPGKDAFFSQEDYKDWELEIDVKDKRGIGFEVKGEPQLELTTCLSPYEKDLDGDGYLDGEDHRPFMDAQVNLHVDELGVADSSDSPDVTSKGDFYLKVKFDTDEWDTNVWQHSKVPIKKDRDRIESQEFPSGSGLTMKRDVPDNKRTIDIRIELWDDDIVTGEGQADQQMDLESDSEKVNTLNLEYDIVDETWHGDDSGSSSSYETHNGKGDGGDSTVYEQKDGEIKYRLYTDKGLSPERKETLANKYSPVLKFHKDENYYPRDIRDYLEQTDLKDGDDNTIDSSPTREDLSQHTSSDNYLDWNGDKDIDYGYNIYSHVFKAMNDKIVIQYWFFYLNNDHLFDHEGDWEMIQIILDEYENPQKAGYSQHYGGAKRDWSDVNKVNGTHPEVYVAEGGHASYFESGSDPVDLGPLEGWDNHKGDGMVLGSSNYSIRDITDEDWLNFRGRWGEQVDTLDVAKSPEGPVFRHADTPAYMWIEPIYWHSEL